MRISLNVSRQDVRVAEVLRTRTWRRYYTWYSEDELMQDFQHDLAGVLGTLKGPEPQAASHPS